MIRFSIISLHDFHTRFSHIIVLYDIPRYFLIPMGSLYDFLLQFSYVFSPQLNLYNVPIYNFPRDISVSFPYIFFLVSFSCTIALYKSTLCIFLHNYPILSPYMIYLFIFSIYSLYTTILSLIVFFSLHVFSVYLKYFPYISFQHALPDFPTWFPHMIPLIVQEVFQYNFLIWFPETIFLMFSLFLWLPYTGL